MNNYLQFLVTYKYNYTTISSNMKHHAKTIYTVLFWMPFFFLFIYTHFFDLHTGPMVDEAIWRERSTNFINGIIQKNFRDTYSSSHPGVITMYVSGTSHVISTIMKDYLNIDLVGVQRNMFYIWSFRIGPTIFNSVMVLWIFTLLKYRFKFKIGAYIALLFLAFEPFIIRFSHFTHVDAIQGFTMILSLLYFTLFVYERKSGDAVKSSIFLSLALLSKTPAVILVPFMGLIWIYNHRTLSLKVHKPFISMMLLAGAIVFVLWPILWTDIVFAFKDFFFFTFINVAKEHGGAIDSKNAISTNIRPFFYLETLKYFIHPLTLGMATVGAFFSFFGGQTGTLGGKLQRILIFFAVFFLCAITIAGKKGDRYLYPAIISLAIIAGIWLDEYFKVYKRSCTVFLGILVIGIAFYLNSTLSLHPYYIYSSVSPSNSDIMQRTGLGEGLEKAAMYLDSIDSQKRRPVVHSWYDSSFAPYFSGTTGDVDENNVKADYVVLYGNMYGRDQNHKATKILKAYEHRSPIKTFNINGVPYVWIYKQ